MIHADQSGVHGERSDSACDFDNDGCVFRLCWK